MKIQILNGDGELIELSDDTLDNDNFVQIRLRHADAEMVCDVPLWELMPALIAFDAKRSRRLSEETSSPN